MSSKQTTVTPANTNADFFGKKWCVNSNGTAYVINPSTSSTDKNPIQRIGRLKSVSCSSKPFASLKAQGKGTPIVLRLDVSQPQDPNNPDDSFTQQPELVNYVLSENQVTDITSKGWLRNPGFIGAYTTASKNDKVGNVSNQSNWLKSYFKSDLQDTQAAETTDLQDDDESADPFHTAAKHNDTPGSSETKGDDGSFSGDETDVSGLQTYHVHGGIGLSPVKPTAPVIVQPPKPTTTTPPSVTGH